jgi:hypothetical protein
MIPNQRLHYYQFTPSNPLFEIEGHPEIRPVGRDLLPYLRALSGQQERFRASSVSTSTGQVVRVVIRHNAISWLDFVLRDNFERLRDHVLLHFRDSLFYIRVRFHCRACWVGDSCYVCEFVAQAIRSLRLLVADWQYNNLHYLPRRWGLELRTLVGEFVGIPHVLDRAQAIINSAIYLLDREFAPEIRFDITVPLLTHWIEALRQRTLIPFLDPNFDHHGGSHGESSASRVVPVIEQAAVIRHFSGFVPRRVPNEIPNRQLDNRRRSYRQPAIDLSYTFNITDAEIDYSDSDNPVLLLPGDPDYEYSEEENSSDSVDSQSSEEVEGEFTEQTDSDSDIDN